MLLTGQPGVQVVPTLYDAQGNVIVHAVGSWDPSDSRYFTFDALSVATPIRIQDTTPLSLTASNGGVTSNPIKVLVNLPTLQVKLDQVFNYAGSTQARFYFANPGTGGATNVTVTSVTLDGVAPLNPGDFPHCRSLSAVSRQGRPPQGMASLSFPFLESHREPPCC